MREVARIAVGVVREMDDGEAADGGSAGSVQLVRFVLFSPDALAAFEEALAG